MKKFVMLLAVLAILIVPSSFCAAKKVPVYYGSWNQFLSELKSNSKSIAAREATRYGYDNYDIDDYVEVDGTVAEFNNFVQVKATLDYPSGYIVGIDVYSDSLDFEEFANDFVVILTNTLKIIRLQQDELREFGYQYMKIPSKIKRNSESFKTKFSVPCSKRNMKLDVTLESAYISDTLNVHLEAHT